LVLPSLTLRFPPESSRRFKKVMRRGIPVRSILLHPVLPCEIAPVGVHISGVSEVFRANRKATLRSIRKEVRTVIPNATHPLPRGRHPAKDRPKDRPRGVPEVAEVAVVAVVAAVVAEVEVMVLVAEAAAIVAGALGVHTAFLLSRKDLSLRLYTCSRASWVTLLPV
jgi:hypothetical protein